MPSRMAFRGTWPFGRTGTSRGIIATTLGEGAVVQRDLVHARVRKRLGLAVHIDGRSAVHRCDVLVTPRLRRARVGRRGLP